MPPTTQGPVVAFTGQIVYDVHKINLYLCRFAVAPFVGAWIEIGVPLDVRYADTSPPSWGRGLKSILAAKATGRKSVAPFVGAWIEIYDNLAGTIYDCVAPFVGAWIEIPVSDYIDAGRLGRPLRGGVD